MCPKLYFQTWMLTKLNIQISHQLMTYLFFFFGKYMCFMVIDRKSITGRRDRCWAPSADQRHANYRQTYNLLPIK